MNHLLTAINERLERSESATGLCYGNMNKLLPTFQSRLFPGGHKKGPGKKPGP